MTTRGVPRRLLALLSGGGGYPHTDWRGIPVLARAGTPILADLGVPPERTWDQRPGVRPLLTDKDGENIAFPHPSDAGGNKTMNPKAISASQ